MAKSKNEIAAEAEKQTQRFYLDMLIMLAAPIFMAWYYYGIRALFLLAVSVSTAVLCEVAGSFIVHRKRKPLYDFNAVFTGAVIVLMLPSSFPFAFAAAGTAFAIIVAKIPFGGTKDAPFVPAAAGFAFLCVCWPAEVFTYPIVATQAVTSTSIAAMLQSGNFIRLNIINLFDILTGNIPGPMGTGCILILLAASFYLCVKKPVALLNTLGFILSCAVLALIFPRVQVYSFSSLLSSPAAELSAGSLFFAALFLIPDPATSPNKAFHRFCHGIFSGIFCMLMRYFGAFEEGVCFAVLLSNVLWPIVENRLLKITGTGFKNRRKDSLPSAVAADGGDADA